MIQQVKGMKIWKSSVLTTNIYYKIRLDCRLVWKYDSCMLINFLYKNKNKDNREKGLYCLSVFAQIFIQ